MQGGMPPMMGPPGMGMPPGMPPMHPGAMGMPPMGPPGFPSMEAMMAMMSQQVGGVVWEFVKGCCKLSAVSVT